MLNLGLYLLLLYSESLSSLLFIYFLLVFSHFLPFSLLYCIVLYLTYRQKIDAQRGAVLATELKNNSCRLARWTAQSLLAGADQMKLGYVSRVAPTNATEHTILATQFFKPKDFALQINLNLNNVWGIVKMICELLLSKADGKYVLMKDPNKAILRLYSIPIDTFDDEEASEADKSEGEEGDGDEE